MLFQTPKIPWDDLRKTCSEHKLRYFWWYPRAFWHCIDSKAPTTLKAQKGTKDIVKIDMWNQWFNLNLMKLQECFYVQRTKITTLFTTVPRHMRVHSCTCKQGQLLHLQHHVHLSWYLLRCPYYISWPWMCQLRCCLWRVRMLLDFIKNIFICVSKKNEGLTGLERHECE